MDESLFLLREVASELTFASQAIDRERGVVLSEWRRGDNFQRRRNEQELDFLIPDAYAATRMPIGDAAVLETATREMMVSLYERYYRPERTVLILVGDFDVDVLEKKILDRFSDWIGRGVAGKTPDIAYTPRARPSEASVFVHKDGGDSISVYSLMPYTDLPDTAANRREDNLLMFGIGAIGFGPHVGAGHFGHTGWGGSTAFADPARRLGFAYVTNRLLGFDDGVDPRRARLLDAVYAAL